VAERYLKSSKLRTRWIRQSDHYRASTYETANTDLQIIIGEKPSRRSNSRPACGTPDERGNRATLGPHVATSLSFYFFYFFYAATSLDQVEYELVAASARPRLPFPFWLGNGICTSLSLFIGVKLILFPPNKAERTY
jgi:hypothetical protein